MFAGSQSFEENHMLLYLLNFQTQGGKVCASSSCRSLVLKYSSKLIALSGEFFSPPGSIFMLRGPLRSCLCPEPRALNAGR